ncbi:unnamed protein product [Blepharisma stoltei]|uniref:PPM-type phosphatase domain-containing protein n=1 Tax=Blepharisma stoltei TaxID=1481888 RepID=A0AAU9K1X8_9CILI|nr:unnamed protein product [Blepharisma stoltei]
MGSCECRSKNIVANTFISENTISLREFSMSTNLNIKKRNSLRRLSTRQSVSLELPHPLMVSSIQVNIDANTMWVSGCILPGVYINNLDHNKCQDHALISIKSDSILGAVFDGHGENGTKISNFCGKVTSKFHISTQQYQNDPFDFLKKIISTCDIKLKNPKSFIDVTTSGSTAVLWLFYNSTFYIASVGDSRAVLATKQPPVSFPVKACPLNEERRLQENAYANRNVTPETKIIPVQLSKDQKPDDSEELTRIVESGGRVQRLTDKNGQKIGPYRIWEMNNDEPGLAMSRCIGDKIGEKLGVISKPICYSMPYNKGSDCFAIIASDGIWDVFSNQDAVNFVEFYREKCKKGIDGWSGNTLTNPGNSCIAHLLCEEARTRWISIVEEEASKIDDISCVIVEFENGDGKIITNENEPEAGQ